MPTLDKFDFAGLLAQNNEGMLCDPIEIDK
jgi:hypothetical protein